VELWVAFGELMGVEVELDFDVDDALLLVLGTPITVARAISLSVPQHAMLCVPQHHFSLVGVPSQGVISAFPDPSKAISYTDTSKHSSKRQVCLSYRVTPADVFQTVRATPCGVSAPLSPVVRI